MPVTLGLVGFGAACLAFAGALILLLVAHPGTLRANFLIFAVLASVVWAGATVIELWNGAAAPIWSPIVDAIHTFGWLLFVSVVLYAASSVRTTRSVAAAIGLLGVVAGAAILILETTRNVAGFRSAGLPELL